MEIKNQVLWVVLENGESFLLEKDGWNPGEEVKVFGPLWHENARVWVINVDKIFRYRVLEQREYWRYMSPTNPTELHWKLKDFILKSEGNLRDYPK